MKLPLLSPDAARAARVRSRCHDRLAQHRHRRERREQAAIRVERTLLCGFCALYLTAVAFKALELF